MSHKHFTAQPVWVCDKYKPLNLESLKYKYSLSLAFPHSVCRSFFLLLFPSLISPYLTLFYCTHALSFSSSLTPSPSLSLSSPSRFLSLCTSFLTMPPHILDNIVGYLILLSLFCKPFFFPLTLCRDCFSERCFADFFCHVPYVFSFFRGR